MSEKPQITLTATREASRVDAWVAKECGESRERIKQAITSGLLTVNGRPVKASSKLKQGDHIALTMPPLPLSEAIPEQIPLEVVYEDEYLMVVNKEAGMVVHPAPGHDQGTMVNALLGMGAFKSSEGDLRPGIVHRIDKDTSGLLVVARTPAAREGLIAQFKIHSIKREYVAFVHGVPKRRRGTYDTLHGRNPRHRLKFSSTVDRGKRAVTHYSVSEQFGDLASRVLVTLSTGRTHQVRVHFTDHGHPLIGDPLYRRRGLSPHVIELGKELGRQALHAATLGFEHPITGAFLEFTAPLPEDMQRLLLELRALKENT